MGWVEVRKKGRPRACWRADGVVRRQACDTVELCEDQLREVEQCHYDPPERRRPGRGARGHVPSLTGYMRHGCRGRQCRDVYADYRAEQRAEQKLRLEEEPDRFQHPSATTVWLGCRCGPCATASLASSRRRNAALKQQRQERRERASSPPVHR